MGYQKLEAPEYEVEVLGELLSDPDRGYEIPFQVWDLETVEKKDSSTVREWIHDFFAQAKSKNDLMLFYFGGHGDLGKERKFFFITEDTDKEKKRVNGIPDSFLINEMRYSKSDRIIIILDCCYSGKVTLMGDEIGDYIENEITRKLNEPVLVEDEETTEPENSGDEEKGWYMITSTSGTKQAFEELDREGKRKRAVFTSILTDGLRGKASDKTGKITTEELYKYVLKRMKLTGQRPMKSSSKFVGDPFTILINPDLPRVDDSITENTRKLRKHGVTLLATGKKTVQNIFRDPVQAEDSYLGAIAVYQSALETFLKIKDYQRIVETYEELAFTYLRRERYDESIDMVERALDYDSRRQRAFIIWGSALAKSQKKGAQIEAEKKFKRAIELESDNPQATFNLAFLLGRHGENVKARQQYYKILKRRNTSQDLNTAIDHDLELFFRKSLELYYDRDPNAYYNWGYVLGVHFTKYHDSLEMYDYAISVDSQFYDAYLEKIKLLIIHRSDFKSAFEICQEAVKIKDGDRMLYYFWGYSLYRYAKRRGLLYNEKAEYLKQAIEKYEEAINHNFDDAVFEIFCLYRWGSALRELGEYQEAGTKYKKITELNTNLKPSERHFHSEAHFERGIMLENLNRFGEARVQYELAISIEHGGHSRLREVYQRYLDRIRGKRWVFYRIKKIFSRKPLVPPTTFDYYNDIFNHYKKR